jgi:hypothetical protein
MKAGAKIFAKKYFIPYCRILKYIIDSTSSVEKMSIDELQMKTRNFGIIYDYLNTLNCTLENEYFANKH